MGSWPRRRPFTLRARAAGAAALAAALVLTTGALWLRHLVSEERMLAAERVAGVEAADLSSFIALTGIAPANRVACRAAQVCRDLVSSRAFSAPYAVVTHGRVYGPQATRPISGDEWRLFRAVASSLATSAVGPMNRVGTLSSGDRVVQVWRLTREFGPATVQPRPSGSRFTLFVFVGSSEAEGAVAALDRVLWLELLPAVLLLGGIAWLATGWALRPVEAIRSERAGITAHALDRRVPVPGSGDEIARLAVTTNRALDRLEEAQVRQRRFIADAAHELRSPIASLRTELEVALAHQAGADWPAVVRSALADAERLASLAEDLLLLARLDGGEPLPDARVDIADLARSCVARLRRRTRGGPHLSCRATGPAIVAGSAPQLGRMLGNLLDNAVRHARSRVTVTVRVEGGRVVLEVEDDGPGVPAASRELVFERFARLDDARSRDAGGAGLGLPIARDIAARHGGALQIADSPAGARLVARLPRRQLTGCAPW